MIIVMSQMINQISQYICWDLFIFVHTLAQQWTASLLYIILI